MTARALLMRVAAEVGAGNLHEGYIIDPGSETWGVTVGDEITINPIHATVDVVVHECLHRAFPRWSEQRVVRETRKVRRAMTDEDTMALHAEYKRRVLRLRKAKRL